MGKAAEELLAGKSAAAVLEADGLLGQVDKMVGKAGSCVLGVGVVTKIGVQFFEEGKPRNAFASSVVPMATIVAGLMQKKIYSYEPAYVAEVEVNGKKHEVFLSGYYTKRQHGEAAEVVEGDAVNVHAIRRGTDGVAFTYTKLKSAN